MKRKDVSDLMGNGFPAELLPPLSYGIQYFNDSMEYEWQDVDKLHLISKAKGEAILLKKQPSTHI